MSKYDVFSIDAFEHIILYISTYTYTCKYTNGHSAYLMHIDTININTFYSYIQSQLYTNIYTYTLMYI